MKAKLKEWARDAWFLAQFAGACLVAGIVMVPLLAVCLLMMAGYLLLALPGLAVLGLLVLATAVCG